MNCDWTDKKKYLIHYRMSKFFVRHGLVIDFVHGTKSFEQRKWLEKYKIFRTQKRNQAVNDFEKDFIKLLNNAVFGKTMEIVRNRCTNDFFKKDETDKILQEQSKLTFIGFIKSHENCDSYTFKQNEGLMVKPIYLGFAV